MFARALRWEVYIEKVPPSKMLIDWEFSVGENHIWVWRFHILFNKRAMNSHGAKANGASNSSPGRVAGPGC